MLDTNAEIPCTDGRDFAHFSFCMSALRADVHIMMHILHNPHQRRAQIRVNKEDITEIPIICGRAFLNCKECPVAAEMGLDKQTHLQGN